MPRPIKSSADLPLIFHCMWDINTIEEARPSRCPHTFENPDELFVHLSEDHIGRKALGTLNLCCRWIGCCHTSRVFTKRDNVVSHARSHVHYRANICKDCGSQFKWPQDLKKHCLRQGHTFVEPEGKGKPGPSPVYVVDAKDGSGPALVRYGPSLNGGRQKTYQRFPVAGSADSGGGPSSSKTTLQLEDLPKEDRDQDNINHVSLKRESSDDVAEESAKLPGIESMMARHASSEMTDSATPPMPRQGSRTTPSTRSTSIHTTAMARK
ncbi:UNVERIFIED_CONTAM: hypothetical protein HDU68_000757 [Siphonaria sp. JEL0065]|nr:hypothetical protein HDU68_000757 [Siphonaria sp. JEL0065]